MAGYREFQTGEVLTAANVDDFLAKQAVMKFADSAARDTALGTAVAGGNALREGMASYLDDTNEFEVYDGTSWNGLGGLVAVKSAIFTGTQTNSTATGAAFDVTDLSITHTPANVANKIVVMFQVTGAVDGGASFRALMAARVTRDDTPIGVADAAGSRTSVHSVTSATSGTSGISSVSGVFVDDPSSVSALTYKVQAVNAIMNAGTYTVYVNRSVTDGDAAHISRAVSSLVLMEVKV
ncbi:MAG TPA: hypothetical protein VIG24_10525 [Acidimicrobiia bacterium]